MPYAVVRASPVFMIMNEQANVELLKKLYGAFGSGDIDTIISHLARQFVWRFDAPSIIPYAGEFKTPEEVRNNFFGSLASSTSRQMLYPEQFIAQGDEVVMVGRYSATVAATGKSFEVAVVHLFTFKDGKVTRYINLTDSAQVAGAYTKS